MSIQWYMLGNWCVMSLYRKDTWFSKIDFVAKFILYKFLDVILFGFMSLMLIPKWRENDRQILYE